MLLCKSDVDNGMEITCSSPCPLAPIFQTILAVFLSFEQQALEAGAIAVYDPSEARALLNKTCQSVHAFFSKRAWLLCCRQRGEPVCTKMKRY